MVTLKYYMREPYEGLFASIAKSDSTGLCMICCCYYEERWWLVKHIFFFGDELKSGLVGRYTNFDLFL